MTGISGTFPTSCITLDLSGCTKLTTFPALPATCTTLNLTGCTGITKIKADPKNLKTLNCTGTGILTPIVLAVPNAWKFPPFRVPIKLKNIADQSPIGYWTLNRNVTISSTQYLAIPAGVTLDVNGHTITNISVFINLGTITNTSATDGAITNNTGSRFSNTGSLLNATNTKFVGVGNWMFLGQIKLSDIAVEDPAGYWKLNDNLVILSVQYLTILGDITLDINGYSITNNSVFINYGTIMSASKETVGTITNGTGSTFTNLGELVNQFRTAPGSTKDILTFRAQINISDFAFDVNGNSVSWRLYKDLDISEVQDLLINEDQELETNVFTVTNYGKVFNRGLILITSSGKFDNYNLIENTGTINSSGTIINDSGGFIVNLTGGLIVSNSGSTYTNTKDGRIDNYDNATITINVGTVYVDSGTFNQSANSIFNMD